MLYDILETKDVSSTRLSSGRKQLCVRGRGMYDDLVADKSRSSLLVAEKLETRRKLK